MNNKITKDTIIYQDDIMGDIKVSDLLEFLQHIYLDINKLEDTIYNILSNNNFDDKTISSLLMLNHCSSIKLIIDMLSTYK